MATKMAAGTPTRRGFWSWRLLRLVILFIGLLLLYAGGQILTFVSADKLTQIPRWQLLLAGSAITAIVMIAAYRWLIRWTEKRAATEIGTANALPLLANGILLGFGIFCALYAAFWAMGIATFNGLNPATGLAAAAAISLSSAVSEEIIFRGVVYRILEDSFGTLIALVISGAIFGLMHAINKGATPLSTLAIALEAGILLGAAYTLTRSLWFPIGIHFGWNFTEGGIFGAAVSGQDFKGLIDVKLSGPELLTGGAFGPEASVAAMAVCLLASLIILLMCVNRNAGKPLSFQLRDA